MSITVYYGYRIPIGEITNFLLLAQNFLIEQYLKDIKISPEKKVDKWYAYRDGMLRGEREYNQYLLDQDAMLHGWHIRFSGDYAYAYCYGWMNQKYFREFSKDYSTIVEDYSYWNNTDRNMDITEDEWEIRGEVWDRVLDLPSVLFETFNVQNPNTTYKVQEAWNNKELK